MENFEEYLMEKYPNLFPKDENGKTTYSSCGIGGHEDWEPIIEAMCAKIDRYCANHYTLVPTKKIWPRFLHWLTVDFGKKIYSPIYNLLDPYRGIIPEEVKTKGFYVVRDEWKQRAEKRKRFNWQNKLKNFYYSCYPVENYWDKVFPDQVILNTVKAKFQMARIYTDGGDAYTRAIVSFTESLCDQITQKKLKIEKP